MRSTGINWSELRAAAIALQNVNEAAKRAAANLPPIEQRRFIERVNKRSQREQWINKANNLTPIVANEKPLSKTVQSGSDVLGRVIADDNRETKLGLSKYARNQAKVLSEKGKLKDHRAFKDIVGGAAQLHGWEEKQGESGLHLHMLNLGPTQVKIGNETHDDDRGGQSEAEVVSE